MFNRSPTRRVLFAEMFLKFAHSTLFTLMLIYPIDCQQNWTNCEPNELSDAIFVHTLAVSPMPIKLPGNYNVTFNASVNSYVADLVIDAEVGWTNETTGEMERVYPFSDTPWRVYDSCVVIDKMLFGDIDVIEHDIDIQVDKLLLNALSYHAGCPLLQGNIVFRSETIILPYNLVELNALPKGHYAVKISFNSKSGDNYGCAQFFVNYGGQVLT